MFSIPASGIDWFVLAIALALALGAPEGSARAVRIAVADNRCVEADAIREGLGRTLEIAMTAPDALEAVTAIDVAITPRTQGWDVELRARATDRELQRAIVVESPECAELEAAIVLVGALLLDELWSTEATVHVQPVAPPAPVVIPTPPRPAKRPSIPPPPPWSLRASATARMSVGDLPGVAGGVALELLATAPRIASFGLQVVAWPYRAVDHARFSAIDVALPVCADPVRRPIWALSICAAARAGVLFASGVDVPTPEAAVRPRMLVDAVVDARVRLVGPLWLRGHVGAAVPILRDRFVIEGTNDDEVVHRAWPVVPLVGLGLELRAALGGRGS